MSLWAGELLHIGIGGVLGLIAAFVLRRPGAVWPVLLVSLFVDLDHWLDYLLTMGFAWNAQALLTGSYFGSSQRVIVLLHSWELALALLVIGLISHVGWRDIAFGLGLGLCGHLLVDQFSYHQPALFYSLVVRVAHGFVDPKCW